MNDEHLINIGQLQEVIRLSRQAMFTRQNKAEAYAWINQVLGKFRYFSESKQHRGIVKTYIRSMTGYSDTQLDRLIARRKKTGWIRP